MVKKENIGQIYDSDGTTPINYIVVIDAGSSGSRAHIFSYPDSKSVSFSQGVTKRSPDDDDDDENDGTGENDETAPNNDSQKPDSNNQDSDNDSLDNSSSPSSTSSSDKPSPVVPLKNILPNLSKQGHKWVKKTKPGLSSFSGKPQAVGKKHLKSLLKYAMGVVPESQHYRTPIFLHATAGLRVLKPNDANSLLDAACTYIKSHTDFLLPDCREAVSMIDGEIEGIFGWISSNYLLGGLQDPDTFLHGKNNDHFTFGLLEMGGASTQVTFVPNVTESLAHKQNMYTLNLPSLDGTKDLSFQISSTTFLRFGVNEVHSQVLDSIKNNEDPCTPKGLVTVYDKKTQRIVSIKSAKANKDKKKENDDETDSEPEDETDDEEEEDNKNHLRSRGSKTEIKGTGDYDKCQEIMTPLAVAMRSSATKPEFDFDTNHFIGVSEYWDTAHYGFDMGGRFDHRKLQERVRAYCNSDWDSIAAIKKQKDGPYSDLDTSDLYDLCLRASWVLSVVEHGLGIPVGDLDATTANSTENTLDDGSIHSEELENGFVSPLQSANEIRGTKYSWTLGRALLYASAEQSISEKSQTAGVLSNLNLDSGHFLYGLPVYPRPKFDAKRVSDFKASDHDNDDDDDDDDDDDWDDYLEKHSHRLWGTLVFLLILIVIVYLLLGKLRRRQMWQSFISKFPGRRYSNFQQQQQQQPLTFLGRFVAGVSAAVTVAAGLFTGRGSGNTISNRYRRMAPDSEPVEDLELGAIDDPDAIGLEISSSSSSSSGAAATTGTSVGTGNGLEDQSDNFSISSDDESTARELVK